MKQIQQWWYLLWVLVLGGCLGIRADITIRPSGGGSMLLEYRIAKVVESLGRLDGNAALPTIPVGKTDFQRTVDRVPGLRMRSFSTKTTDTDIVNTVKLEFSDLDALIRFFDATGQHASLVQENGTRRLSLVLSEAAPVDADLLNLATMLSAGYTFNLKFSVPGKGTLRIIDGGGKPVPGVTETTVSITIPELLSYRDGVSLELVW